MKVLLSLKKCRYMQYLCVFIVTLLQACQSTSSTWVSPVLPLLTSNSTPLEAPLTAIEESLFVSGEKIGAVIGCVLAGVLIDLIGRKRTLLLAAIPIFVSMMASAFNKINLVLIILRVMFGLATGLCLVVMPLFIGEISDKDIRGRLSFAQSLLSTLGNVYVYSVGPFISFKSLSISAAILPLVYAVLFAFMPESPYYLVKKGQIESASNSLRQLSRRDLSEEYLQLRLQEVQNFVARDINNKVHLKDLFVNKIYKKSFLIVLALRLLITLSGSHVFSSYLQKIIQTSGSSISAELSSVIFGVIKLPSVLLAAFLVDRFGRRPLLIISTIGCTLTLIAEGVYFYLRETIDVSAISWVPTTGLSLYLLSVNFGIEILPALVAGEIFTVNIKGLSSACVQSLGFLLSFLLLNVFNPISDALGLYTMFWFFSFCCILGCLFAIFVLPETKGKTFAEIQEMLAGKKGIEFINLKENK